MANNIQRIQSSIDMPFVIIFLAITFIFASLTYRSYNTYIKLPKKGIATTATVEDAFAGSVCGKPPVYYCLRLSYKTADGKNYTVNYVATKSFWNTYWNKFHNGDANAPKPTTEIYYSPNNPTEVAAKSDKILDDLLFYAFFYVWTTGVSFALYKKLTKIRRSV